ncbi:hypothetical protein GQ42DRAFT_162278 [Ramicandelaber brevisporus]|nr:hypothetical protein GQ42DRAFT_162278 [Ramicandelaber brevisporus]
MATNSSAANKEPIANQTLYVGKKKVTSVVVVPGSAYYRAQVEVPGVDIRMKAPIRYHQPLPAMTRLEAARAPLAQALGASGPSLPTDILDDAVMAGLNYEQRQKLTEEREEMARLVYSQIISDWRHLPRCTRCWPQLAASIRYWVIHFGNHVLGTNMKRGVRIQRHNLHRRGRIEHDSTHNVTISGPFILACDAGVKRPGEFVAAHINQPELLDIYMAAVELVLKKMKFVSIDGEKPRQIGNLLGELANALQFRSRFCIPRLMIDSLYANSGRTAVGNYSESQMQTMWAALHHLFVDLPDDIIQPLLNSGTGTEQRSNLVSNMIDEYIMNSEFRQTLVELLPTQSSLSSSSSKQQSDERAILHRIVDSFVDFLKLVPDWKDTASLALLTQQPVLSNNSRRLCTAIRNCRALRLNSTLVARFNDILHVNKHTVGSELARYIYDQFPPNSKIVVAIGDAFDGSDSTPSLARLLADNIPIFYSPEFRSSLLCFMCSSVTVPAASGTYTQHVTADVEHIGNASSLTSQHASKSQKKLSARYRYCLECKLQFNRDTSAAFNILRNTLTIICNIQHKKAAGESFDSYMQLGRSEFIRSPKVRPNSEQLAKLNANRKARGNAAREKMQQSGNIQELANDIIASNKERQEVVARLQQSNGSVTSQLASLVASLPNGRLNAVNRRSFNHEAFKLAANNARIKSIKASIECEDARCNVLLNIANSAGSST